MSWDGSDYASCSIADCGEWAYNVAEGLNDEAGDDFLIDVSVDYYDYKVWITLCKKHLEIFKKGSVDSWVV